VFDTPPSPHNQTTTADGTTVRTVTPPSRASACYISVRANGIYLTVDGTTPSATNGLELANGGSPLLLLVPSTLKWVSAVAGGSTVNVLWVE
jgi:hypothetical protein